VRPDSSHLEAAASGEKKPALDFALRVPIAVHQPCVTLNEVHMNIIWRFFRDEAKQWRWQQLKVNREMIAESQGFKLYEQCIADGEKNGYLFHASQEKTRR
jgi:uncharacterized protein YegP (UPF0339 family)